MGFIRKIKRRLKYLRCRRKRRLIDYLVKHHGFIGRPSIHYWERIPKQNQDIENFLDLNIKILKSSAELIKNRDKIPLATNTCPPDFN